MTPRLLELEPRDCPTVTDLGGGVLHVSTGHELQVFPDWRGGLNYQVGADGKVWVGPTAGGGEVVAVLDPDGTRDRPDFFAGDPASRAGVVFVNTGGLPAAPPPTAVPAAGDVPALTYGDVDNPQVWRVYLLYEHPFSAAQVRAVTAALWRLVRPLGNIALTTVRPGDYPGNYGVVTVGADLRFTGDAGDTVARWDEPHSNWFDGGVYVDTRLDELGGTPEQPEDEAVELAHELGHALGLGHSTGLPYNVMSYGHVAPDEVFTAGDVAAARAGAAQAVALEYRPDPTVPTPPDYRKETP